jgi:glutamine synthetase
MFPIRSDLSVCSERTNDTVKSAIARDSSRCHVHSLRGWVPNGYVVQLPFEILGFIQEKLQREFIRLMKSICLEYIWLDSEEGLRSKTRIENKFVLSDWSFDGSSCGLSTVENSDIILRPAFHCIDPFRKDGFLVLCEIYLSDGKTPHPTNLRAQCKETKNKCREQEPWVGLEQEYILFQPDGILPFGWTKSNEFKQGPYYCGVGSDRALGRPILEEFLQNSLQAGLHVGGINLEVCPSQQEYQIGPLDPLQASDELWMSRYILFRTCEKWSVVPSFHPKPLTNYSGSGCHCNFSTKEMRNSVPAIAIEKVKEACERLRVNHSKHMQVYGKHNKLRLIGTHETSSFEHFTYADKSRQVSVRIPLMAHLSKKFYLEDRRPASNCNPYAVVDAMMQTICCSSCISANPYKVDTIVTVAKT